MITIIRIIECGASQLSRGGIRRETFSIFNLRQWLRNLRLPGRAAALLEKLFRRERDSRWSWEFESKRNFENDNKKEKESETRWSTYVELQPVTSISQTRSFHRV